MQKKKKKKKKKEKKVERRTQDLFQYNAYQVWCIQLQPIEKSWWDYVIWLNNDMLKNPPIST